MNNCHIFYEEDLEKLIREVAFEEMFAAPFRPDQDEDLPALVNRIAYFNDGVRNMAEKLIDALRAEAEEGEPNE